MPRKWKEQDGLFVWEPEPGVRFECVKYGHKNSRSYYARRNGVYLPGKRKRIFRGPLEACKQLCEEHHDRPEIRAEARRRYAPRSRKKEASGDSPQ